MHLGRSAGGSLSRGISGRLARVNCIARSPAEDLRDSERESDGVCRVPRRRPPEDASVAYQVATEPGPPPSIPGFRPKSIANAKSRRGALPSRQAP